MPLFSLILFRYNFVAKKLNRRLLQLGATPLLDLGLGDDQHPLGYDGTLDPWLMNFWDIMLSKFPLPEGLSIIPPTVLYPHSLLFSLLLLVPDISCACSPFILQTQAKVHARVP